jgi:mono/diheme cytochrome c family protein
MRRLAAPAALVAALALALAACGGDDEEGSEGQGETTTATATEPAPATEGNGTAGETATEGDTETEGEASEQSGDPEAGADVFASAGCGNCHTYAPAGSEGAVGPNLDDSDVTFDEAVTQIENGGNGMPAFEGQLSEEEIRNVAAFVVARGELGS